MRWASSALLLMLLLTALLAVSRSDHRQKARLKKVSNTLLKLLSSLLLFQRM
jgi:hypothetical protein